MPDDQQQVTRATLRADLEALESRLLTETDTRHAALESRLIEAMRDMQTEVLTAFHGWARPAEIRMRGLSTSVQGLD